MYGACGQHMLSLLVSLALLTAKSDLWAAQRSVSTKTPVQGTGNDPRDRGGHSIKVRIADGRPIAGGVFLNGCGPFRFLVDTGSQANLIAPEVAESIGLRSTFRSGLVSAAGRAITKGIEDVDVSLSGLNASQQVFL